MVYTQHKDRLFLFWLKGPSMGLENSILQYLQYALPGTTLKSSKDYPEFIKEMVRLMSKEIDGLH